MRRISETVSDVSGDLGRSKYLLSQMKKTNKQTNKQTTDPHKEIRANKEEKGKDNKNLQDMCKNHQGLQQKTEGICKICYPWVTVITPDICQILQEKPSNGKLKMVLFRMKK